MTYKVNTLIEIFISLRGKCFFGFFGYNPPVLETSTTTRLGTLETPGEILGLLRRFPAGLTKTEAASMAGLSRTALNQRIDRRYVMD